MIGSRENWRVEPRRAITFSIVSVGMESLDGWSGVAIPLGAGKSLDGVLLPRRAVTSLAESSEEASCILRMAG